MKLDLVSVTLSGNITAGHPLACASGSVSRRLKPTCQQFHVQKYGRPLPAFRASQHRTKCRALAKHKMRFAGKATAPGALADRDCYLPRDTVESAAAFVSDSNTERFPLRCSLVHSVFPQRN